MSKFAWVTLTTNDTYSLGALVLAHSLKRVSTAHQLAVLVTSGVSEAMRNRLREVYNVVQEVNVLDSQDAANLTLLQRPELGITFTKLHCWKLVQFEKCVFLDADILVVQNCDELFEREELSAAPDISWPDCFNSGVFVFRPSVETYGKLTEFALQFGSFDGGDQGLLNQYFSDWAQKDISKRLPFIYNTHAFASYSYLPAFKQFRDRIKILHFAGRFKPWLANFNSESKTAYPPHDFQHISDLIQLWWTIYCGSVHQGLSDEMNFIAAAIYGHMWQNMDTRYEEYSQFENPSDQIDYDPSYDEANYYDPWDDYYENLEKCEQNQQNWENTTKKETFRHVEFSHHEESTYNAQTHNIPNPSTNIEQNNPCLTCSTELNKNVSETSSHLHSVQPELRIEDNSQNLICSEYNTELNMVRNYIHCDSTNKQESHQFSCETTEEFAYKQNTVKEHFQEETNYEATSHEEQVVVEPTQVPQLCLDDSVFKSNSENFSAQNNNNSVESEENVRTPAETNNENSVEEAGLAGALSRLTLGTARTPEQEAYEQHMRRQCWESGNIDYTGVDSFDNIWKKITQTLEAGAAKKESETKSNSARFTTSADIQDGKVEFDKATNSTITYKKIPKGYQMVIETPQPNGTLKTQTKTFYDPVPVPADEIEENGSAKKTTRTQKDSKNISDRTIALSNPNTTVVTRKIPNGREEVYTTVNADGTKSIQIKTFYDAQEEEITETTQVEEEVPGETRIITKQKTPQQQKQLVQQEGINKKQVVQQQQTSVQKHEQQQQTSIQKHEQQQVTQQVKIQHFQETKQFSQTTEISGKSITTKNEESLQAISDQTTEKKKKKKTKSAPPPPIEDKPGQKTTVIEKKIVGGTEYHYTTILEDGKTVTSVKTVYDEEEVDMTEEEIKKYKKQLKEAEKHKNLTEATSIPTKHGNKQVIPSAENPGEVTTVETKKIKGGTEYHYTTVTADGVVKKSSKTVYDPVPVEGSDEEEEIIEEYEEEVIEPGETITETYQTTKTLSHVEHHEETVQKKKKGKIVKK